MITITTGNPFHLLLWFADSEWATLLSHNKEAGGSLLVDNRRLLTRGCVETETRRGCFVVKQVFTKQT